MHVLANTLQLPGGPALLVKALEKAARLVYTRMPASLNARGLELDDAWSVGRSVGTKLTGRNLRPRVAGGMRCIDQRWMIDRISPRAIQPNPNMCVVSRTCVFFILCISISIY